MKNFISHLGTITGKGLNELSKLESFFEKKTVLRGTILLKPGEKVSAAWNIYSGILRAYYYMEENKHTWKNEDDISLREITPWIVPAPGFLTDIPGFLLQRPSKIYIEALEDCVLYCLSHKNYKSMQHELPEFASLIFERSLILADSNMRLMHLRRPIDRLQRIEKIYPGISNRVSVNIMASFLNIDPTTLSKLRSKK